ncbi:MAG TPA: TerC family protein [Chiayiivirga sp.]|nr:TerC family protein [Chiayiivirga sp.]
MHTIGTPLMWVAFTIIVIIALAADLFVLRSKGPHKVATSEALKWSAAWIALALLFNVGLWWYLRGPLGDEQAKHIALQFFTGYLVEKALAVDNIFVFLMVFGYFAVPPVQQQRALIYGIIGAILLRTVMIFIGAALIQKFDWVLYIFGAFLVFTGVKMLWGVGDEPDIGSNPALTWIRKRLAVTSEYHGTRFVIRENGTRWFTPLFVVVMMIGITDVIFAVDSIPAIFAITDDPFIVLTSNVFAVLGLRALFFVLAGMADKFHLLAYGLATVLIFIGVKMLIMHFWHIPIGAALVVVALAIGTSMVASVLFPPKNKEVD